MDFEEEFELEHLLFKERKCRSCGQVKDLLTDFYKIRKGRLNLSAYSYECKECTIKRILDARKRSHKRVSDIYPDW